MRRVSDCLEYHPRTKAVLEGWMENWDGIARAFSREKRIFRLGRFN